MDTLRGVGMAPALVLWHVERLPDTSMTNALEQGGMEHFGWGQDRHLAADQYDAAIFVGRVAGQWGGKPPDIPLWPRPKSTPIETLEERKARFSVKRLWAKWNSLT